MNPKQAVENLIANGWSEARIASEVGTSQPTIHRIKHGRQRRGAAFETCQAIIRLVERIEHDVAEPVHVGKAGGLT